MAVDWDDLRFFLAVARARTLTAAGRSIRVDQATVGRRLGALERALGARLFDRSRDGYVLTAAGESLLTHAERVEDEMDSAQRALGGRETRLAGMVRLTTPVVLGGTFLTPHLATFARRYPDIAIELVADDRPLNLTKREAELALRIGRPTQPQLVARHVGDLGSALYGAESYLREHPFPRGGDLNQHRFVGFNEGYSTSEQRWIDLHARGATIGIRVNSTLAALGAAVGGMGLTVLPCYLIRPEHRLKMLVPPKAVQVDSVWLVMHRDLRHTARVRVLSEFISDVVRQHAALLRGA